MEIKRINILGYTDSDFSQFEKVLSTEYGWRNYPVKHAESIFTKFYQSYILPTKFGFDKRKAHLSDQINSGYINRNNAIQVLTGQFTIPLMMKIMNTTIVLKNLKLPKIILKNICIPTISHHDYFVRNAVELFLIV